MDKHLTEIELFEYANHLIKDESQLNGFKQHLEGCSECQAQLKLEESLISELKSSLKVTHQVDLSEKIAHYFAQDKPNLIGLDSKGIIYVILGLAGVMMLTQVVEINIKSIQIDHLNMIVSSIVGLLFVELVYKYVKYKRGNSRR